MLKNGVSKIIDSGIRYYTNLSSKLLYVMLFLFILSLLSKLPGILILEIDEEPGYDGSFYYDVAHNIAEGDGPISDIKDKWYVDWEEKKGEVETRSPYPPLFMYLLSILFRFNDSLFAIRVLNSILSSLSVCLFFLLVSKRFSWHVSFWSSILYIFNPLAYLYSVSLLTEPFYLCLLLMDNLNHLWLLYNLPMEDKINYFLYLD